MAEERVASAGQTGEGHGAGGGFGNWCVKGLEFCIVRGLGAIDLLKRGIEPICVLKQHILIVGVKIHRVAHIVPLRLL